MNFIEITQDGAGIVKNNDSSIDGIITDSVDTCWIYVFYGTKSFAIIHDTGQLKISEICDIAKKCGEIVSVFYAVNPKESEAAHKKLQFTAHEERRKQIKNFLKLGIFTKIEIPTGSICCMKNETILVDNEYAKRGNINNIPNRKIRESINDLNNLFSPANSQSLNVDFQFDGEKYTALPKLLNTREVMTDVATLKSRLGDNDYFDFLRKAESLGVFNLT